MPGAVQGRVHPPGPVWHSNGSPPLRPTCHGNRFTRSMALGAAFSPDPADPVSAEPTPAEPVSAESTPTEMVPVAKTEAEA